MTSIVMRKSGWGLGALIYLLATVSLTANVTSPQGGDPQTKQSLFDQLQHQDILELSLEMDMVELMANRRNEDKIAAKMTFTDAFGVIQNWDAKVNVRGKYRRSRCAAMPPLKLDFSKKDLKAAGLSTFDDMKLVTHCAENEAEAKQLLLKEYLVYKLYNQITEESFRVQFLKITYIDSKTGEKNKNYGFFIEDTAELRARIQAKKWENPIGIAADSIDQEQLKRVAVFECMIGNVDWDYSRGHNVKVLNKNGKAIFIPYDFDFSGLVKAPYATLKTEIGQTSMDERFYLAYPEDLAGIESTLALFRAHQEDLIQTVKSVKPLNLHSKRETIQYLDDFFEQKTAIKVPQNN